MQFKTGQGATQMSAYELELQKAALKRDNLTALTGGWLRKAGTAGATKVGEETFESC